MIPLAAPAPFEPRATRGGTVPALLAMLDAADQKLSDGDLVVLTSKIVGLLEGYAVRLDDVVPSRKARRLGRLLRRDPRKLELVLREGKVRFVVPMDRISRIPSVWGRASRLAPRPTDARRGYDTTNRSTLMIWKHGAFLDEGGIDFANVSPGYVGILPPDLCATARDIRREVRDQTGRTVAVVITDTITPFGRFGSQDIALGYAGIAPVAHRLFDVDLFGLPRSGGANIVIDSVAAFSGLIMGQKTELTPALIVRGLDCAAAGPDDATSIDDVAMPADAGFRIGWHVVMATVWFRLASLLTFSRQPRP